MLDLYLLSLIGFGLLCIGAGWRLARNAFRNRAMGRNVERIMR